MLIERKRQGKQEVDNWPLGTIIRSDQSLSRVRLFVTPWIAARQASLSITNSRSSPRLVSIESVMPSSHLILCHPLLLLPPIPPSIRVFSNESTLRMRYHNRLLLTQVTALSQPVKHVSSQVIKAICISTEVMFISRCLRSVCVCKLSRFSCVQPTLCDPTDCSPPGSSDCGILQARILESVAMPSSRGSSQPRDWTPVSYVSCIGRWVLYHWHHLGSQVVLILCKTQ